MRNPFARLAKRDAPKPSLREHAAALKASASRVIRGQSVAEAASSPAQFDPVFNLIDEHRAALTAWRQHLDESNALPIGSPAFEAAEAGEDEPAKREAAAYKALLAARPVTLAGLLALADYLPDALVKTGMADDAEPGVIALRTVCQSVLQQAGAIIEARDPVLDLIAAHERAYGQRLFCSAYHPGTPAERRAILAEERAYRAFLHSPLSTDAGRVAYATAVFNREMHKPTPRFEGLDRRDHPLAVAGRNLSFGEYARETWPGGRLAASSVEAPLVPESLTTDGDTDPFEGRECPAGVVPYPFDKPVAEGAADASPILAEMVAQWLRLRSVLEDADLADDEAAPLHRRWVELQYKIYEFPSATLPDLQAKVVVLRDELGNAAFARDETSPDLPTSAWRGVLADIERLSNIALTGPSPEVPKLTALSVQQLANLYDRYTMAGDTWADALNAPWANAAKGPDAAHDVVEAEQDRACRLRDAVAKELITRQPLENAWDEDRRLDTLIRHEMLCNGSLRHAPGLRAAIAKQWGA